MIMPPALRKFTLAVHLTVSVGWIGSIAAYIAFDVATVTAQDAQTLRTAYLAMERIAQFAIVPLAVSALVTGLVVSLWTKWGLFRHYWVVISLVMTTLATAVLLIETGTIRALAAMAADPALGGEELRAMPSTLLHSIGGSLVLVVVLVLNIYKPRGLTRYGWRKEQQRKALTAERAERPRQPSAP